MDNRNSSGAMNDLSAQALEIARRRQAAALGVVEMLEDQYETVFGAHAGSLLRAAAWLAGTSLYRSFGFPASIAPGSPVLSEKANEEGMKLLKVFLFLVERDGIKLKQSDFQPAIPEEHKARASILEVQKRFQRLYNEIMKEHGFDYQEGAKAGAVACARLMKFHCSNRKDIEPGVAASIVSMGFVEGTKTAPAPLND